MEGGLQFCRGGGVLTGQGRQLVGQLAVGGLLLLNGGILRGQLFGLGAVAFSQRGAVAQRGGQAGCLALQLAALLPQGVASQQGGGEQQVQQQAADKWHQRGDHAASLSARS
ncbi:hypothetical protein [Chromobacterium violaceum]|uniref:hypothetical protein n=1 Tax=Chromobacterium violaceum TaxID=536 RepID=UPI0009DA74C8|nr:hypothetical protein B0T41_00040 [Chromobacterium violaceum]